MNVWRRVVVFLCLCASMTGAQPFLRNTIGPVGDGIVPAADDPDFLAAVACTLRSYSTVATSEYHRLPPATLRSIPAVPEEPVGPDRRNFGTAETPDWRIKVSTYTWNYGTWQGHVRFAPIDLYYLSGSVTNYISSWVTVGDDLPEYLATTYSTSNLTVSNVEQKVYMTLGMPPASGKVLVQFWVRPADLVRPAYNNSLTNTVEPPVDGQNRYHLVAGADSNMRAGVRLQSDSGQWFLMGQDAFGAFFTNNFNTRYPWTAMGYTWNWDPSLGTNDTDRIGPDEFIISGGAQVFYERTVPNDKLLAAVRGEPLFSVYINGSEYALHYSNTVAQISAPTAGAGQVFVGWLGDTQALGDVMSPTPQVTMPGTNVFLTARFVTWDELPLLTNGAVAAGTASAHTNMLFRYEPAGVGRSVVFVLSSNAADAVVSVFEDGFEAVSVGTGSVVVEPAGDAPLVVSITSSNALSFEIKTVDVTETHAAMRRTLAQYPEIPGLGVAACQPGFLPIVLAEGLAAKAPPSAGDNRPLTGEASFHIASISKTYTAAAIFLLQQRGLLEISGCVTNYAPELDIPRGNEITIEHLLQHRSGLPDANNTVWFDGKLANNPLLEFTVEEIVDVARQLYPDLLFDPGTDYAYTDTGYNILARVVENVSGTNYQAFLQNQVLMPAGLNHTYAPYNHQAIVPNPAVNTYMLINGELQDRSVWNPSVEFGCGSIISTLSDLLAMTHVFFGSTNLLTSATQAQMMDPVSATTFDDYGRGCNRVDGLGWGHDGTMWGALSTARFDTNNGVCVSSMLNCQYEDERLYASFFALRGVTALLKQDLGFPAGSLGRQPPILFPVVSSARQGQPFRFQPLAFNFATNWLIEGLPAGMGYDTTSGAMSGAPAVIGTHSVTVTAQNAYGRVTEVLSFEVRTAFTNTIAVVSDWIETQMAEDGTVGVSIALVDDQETVWARGFGYADREAHSPVTTATVFRIGSVSKVFTAAAALQYVDRGTLGLDDAVTNYTPSVNWLPRFPGARPISVLDLLTHHSGLPGDLVRAGFLTLPSGRGYLDTLQDLSRTYPVLEPGTLNNYCNTGFTLLEGVIEQAARLAGEGSRSFAQIADANIFSLLDMQGSSFLCDKPAISNSLAVPYLGGERMPAEYVEILGTGGMYSRPVDLAAFMKAVMGGGTPLMSATRCARMLQDHSTNAPLDRFQWIKAGLGWDTVSEPRLDDAGKACWKNGGTMAYGAMLTILPEKKLGVAIVASSMSEIPFEADKLALQVALLERDGMPWPTNALAYPFATQTVSQAALDALAGIYVGSDGYDRVEAQDGMLTYHRDVPDGPLTLTNLVLRTDGWFMADAAPAFSMAFTNSHGRDLVIRRQAVGAAEYSSILAERFTPPVISAAWSNRIGRTWTARNIHPDDYMPLLGIGPDVRLLQQDGVLHVSTDGRTSTKVLVPQDDALAFVAGVLNRGDSALQIVGEDEFVIFGGYWFGPEPMLLPVSGGVTGSIATAGFAQWHEIMPANPVTPVGGISNVFYEITLSGAPDNFILTLYGADRVVPRASRRGNGVLEVASDGSPNYLVIQPAAQGVQTGGYSLAFSVPLRIRAISAAAGTLRLTWQAAPGIPCVIETATGLGATNTFSPLSNDIPAGGVLKQQVLTPDGAPSRFYRIRQ